MEALDAAFADNQVDVLVSVNNYHSAQYATANYPAITVPLGKRANGMPVGVTLIGKPGDEAKLLAYAYALEQATKLRVTPDVDQFVAEANAPARAFTYGDAWQPISCDELAVAPAIAAKADCGYVTVPEKRGESGLALGDKTIQLGVVRLRSTGKTPGAPIFQGEGGPGGAGPAVRKQGRRRGGHRHVQVQRRHAGRPRLGVLHRSAAPRAPSRS